jgi:hypothetical protein
MINEADLIERLIEEVARRAVAEYERDNFKMTACEGMSENPSSADDLYNAANNLLLDLYPGAPPGLVSQRKEALRDALAKYRRLACVNTSSPVEPSDNMR